LPFRAETQNKKLYLKDNLEKAKTLKKKLDGGNNKLVVAAFQPKSSAWETTSRAAYQDFKFTERPVSAA